MHGHSLRLACAMHNPRGTGRLRYLNVDPIDKNRLVDPIDKSVVTKSNLDLL